MAKTKKLTEKQQSQLDKVKDYIGSLGYDFNNAQEMEEAFISKEIKKSGAVNQFAKLNRSPIKDLLDDNNVFDRNPGVVDYIAGLDKKLGDYAQNAKVRQRDGLSHPDADTGKEVSVVAARGSRELQRQLKLKDDLIVKLTEENAKLRAFYDQHHESIDFLTSVEINPNTLF